MICLYIEIHNYRQLLRVSPDTVRRVESEIRSLVSSVAADECSGINGGRILFFLGEAQYLGNRPRFMDSVYGAALRCEATLRSESKELYGYKLVIEKLNDVTPEAVLHRFQVLMLSVPEEDTLWLTPQVLPLFHDKRETGAVVQHSSRWFCVPPPNTNADLNVVSPQRDSAPDTVQERLLDWLGNALNSRSADRVFKVRCSDVAFLAKEMHSAFLHYCGEVDEPPYLRLVGSKEYSFAPYETLRRTLSAIDPEWLQLHLPQAGRRIVRESYGNLSERTAFRFGSDPVQAKDYLIMLGLIVDAYSAHAEASGLPFVLLFQEPEHMDRSSRAVVQRYISCSQSRSTGAGDPIPVVLSGGSSRVGFTWAAPVYSLFVPSYQPQTREPELHMILESVLENEEIQRVAIEHPAALALIEKDRAEASKSYDDCSTEVRRLRGEYGNLLCARYVNLRTGIHLRVVAALEWAGRWQEAFMLWNDLLNAAIERGCVPEAVDILAGAPVGAHNMPAQSELDLAIEAGHTRLKALSPGAESIEADNRGRGKTPLATGIRSGRGRGAQGTSQNHGVSSPARAELNWILACADTAVAAGDSGLLKQCAKDALMRAQELGDRESAGRAQLHLADSLLMLGRVNEAREYAGRVRSEAKTNSFGVHEHGMLLEGCAYFLDGNLTRVGEVLEALRERETMVLIPAAFRVLRRILGFRHALELGRHNSARALLGELRQFLELIGKKEWALSMRDWDALCVLGEGGDLSEAVFEPQDRDACSEMLRERHLIGAATRASQGRASASLELLHSIPVAEPTRTTIFLLRPPRVFLIEEQALGPETVFERMLATCKAISLLQRGGSAAAGELMGSVCRDAAHTAVDPYRRLYLFVYSMALSRSKGPDDPDPGAVLGQAVRLLRERTARIENPQEKLEFQRANPINRRIISMAREHNLW